MADLSNILPNGSQPDEAAIKRYLEGNATEEERFAIENQMSDEAFLNDAIEGLQEFKDKDLMQEYVVQLNKDLQKQTDKKKARKLKRALQDQDWTIIAIVVVLLLCSLGYAVIHLLLK